MIAQLDCMRQKILGVLMWLRSKLVQILSFLFGPMIRALLRCLGWTLLPSQFENRIGHQITEPLYLELLRLAGRARWTKALVLWDPSKIANQWAFDALPESFVRIKNAHIRALLNLLSHLAFSRSYPSPTQSIGAIGVAAEIFKYTNLVTPNFEFLKIPEEAERERKVRIRLGIPLDAWICTLHVREPGEFDDELTQAYRNSSPENLALAIGEITSRGGFVVRVGQNQVKRVLPSESVKYSELNSSGPTQGEDELLLCRASRFFIGNSSGALAMAVSHGIPVAAVNVAPLGALKIWGPRDLAIPKLYQHENSGKLASFSEILHTGTGDLRSSSEIHSSGFRLVENSAAEIKEVVLEMVNRLDGIHVESELDSRLQSQMQELFVPSNYTFFSKTRIGADFLRSHSSLLS
jgi:putative glycosyltransferase (TIGR04372 family)